MEIAERSENQTNDTVHWKGLLSDFQGKEWKVFSPINKAGLKEVLADLNKKECEEDPSGAVY